MSIKFALLDVAGALSIPGSAVASFRNNAWSTTQKGDTNAAQQGDTSREKEHEKKRNEAFSHKLRTKPILTIHGTIPPTREAVLVSS